MNQFSDEGSPKSPDASNRLDTEDDATSRVSWCPSAHHAARARRVAFDAWRLATLAARADELRLRASHADHLFTADARRWELPRASAERLWRSLLASDVRARRRTRRRPTFRSQHLAAPVFSPTSACVSHTSRLRGLETGCARGVRRLRGLAFRHHARRRQTRRDGSFPRDEEQLHHVASLFVLARRRASTRDDRLGRLARLLSPRRPLVPGFGDAGVAHARRTRARDRERRRGGDTTMASVQTARSVSRVARRRTRRRESIRASRGRVSVRDVRGRGVRALASTRGPPCARSRVGRVRRSMARASRRRDDDARVVSRHGGGARRATSGEYTRRRRRFSNLVLLFQRGVVAPPPSSPGRNSCVWRG